MAESIYVQILRTDLNSDLVSKSINTDLNDVFSTIDGRYVFLEFLKTNIPASLLLIDTITFDQAAAKTELNNGTWVNLTDVTQPFPPVRQEDIRLKKVDSSSASITFIGETRLQDASTSAAVWRLQQEIVNNNEVTTSFANDGRYDQIWDDRAIIFPIPFEDNFSVLFDGINDFILIGNVSELRFNRTEPFSISLWFKKLSSNDTAAFSNKTGNANSSGYTFFIKDFLRFNFAASNGGANRIEVETVRNDLDDSAWHNGVITYDGSSLASGVNIYIDGASEATNTNNDNLTSDPGSTIAAQISGRNGTTNAFDSNIGDVSIWNKELSSGEVSSIYNSGAPNDLREHSAAANLVGYWFMGDFDDFPNINDRSVNNNVGVMTNMVIGDIVEDTP